MLASLIILCPRVLIQRVLILGGADYNGSPWGSPYGMDVFRLNNSFTWECQLNQTLYADDLRFAIDGIAGSTIAMFSVANNLLLFYVFSTSRKLRKQNYANPVLLALFDCIVSLCYLGVISLQAIAYHFRIPSLVYFWANHVRVLYCFQQSCCTICNFLLVVASLERFCVVAETSKQNNLLIYSVRWKAMVLMAIFIFAVAIKGTLYFETTLIELPHCNQLENVVPVMKWSNTAWSTMCFVTRKLLTVILPFFVIVYCNGKIVWQLKQRRNETKKQSIIVRDGGCLVTKGSLRQHYNEKKGVRVATRTLLMVAGCYFTSNSVSLVINIVEFFVPQVLEKHYYAYLLVQDFSMLLTILGCMCRLPIYCLSDRRIRNAVCRAVIRCANRARPLELPPNNLEKWSLVIVSNSLRSNMTAANPLFQSQEWLTGRVQRTKDELAFLLHNKRRLLVDMTFRLAQVQAQNERLVEESTTAECDYVTEEEMPCLQKELPAGWSERLAHI